MSNNRKYDWPRLIEAFEQSGLTQSQFCKDNSINPRYFSLKLGQYRQKTSESFAKVEVCQEPIEGLILEVGQCKIACPSSMPLESLAFLVRTLA